MKKVLLIGGTGTISTEITKRLAQDPNIDLYLLNRGNRKLEIEGNYTSILGDINQFDEIKKILEPYQFDVVCNFVLFSPEQAKMNYELFKNKTKQFIFISTAVTYYRDEKCVFDETSKQGNPYSQYGQMKEAVESYFLEKYEEGFPITIIRPSQTYSRDRIPLSVKGKTCWSVVERMLAGKEVIVHGDGQSIWACTHSKDFAKAFKAVVGNEETIGQAYQIMNDELLTWDMIYQTLARELKVEYKPVYIPSSLLRKAKKYDLNSSIYGDKRNSCIFDISKIKEIIPEFTCEINLEAGIKEYLKYMDEHPELKIHEPEFDTWCDNVIEGYRQLEEKMREIL